MVDQPQLGLAHSGEPQPRRYRVDAIRTALTMLDRAARQQGFLPVTIELRTLPDGTLTFAAQGPKGEDPQISIPASRLEPGCRL